MPLLGGLRPDAGVILVDAGRIPAMAGVTARLGELMPTPNPQVSVLHNDLKPDNCQWRPEDPDRVSSIFDWDMATIGDPLVDLGTLLNYWPDPADTASAPAQKRSSSSDG